MVRPPPTLPLKKIVLAVFAIPCIRRSLARHTDELMPTIQVACPPPTMTMYLQIPVDFSRDGYSHDLYAMYTAPCRRLRRFPGGGGCKDNGKSSLVSALVSVPEFAEGPFYS